MDIADLSPQRRSLFGALSALAHAVFGSEHKADDRTNMLIRKGLTCSESEIENVLFSVRAEKDRIAPDCRICTHPCGRTAEYDLRDLEQCDPEIRERKLILLQILIRIACENETDDSIPFLYEGIRAFSEDYPAPGLDLLIRRAMSFISD